MSTLATIQAIDAAIGALSAVMNLVGASQPVSAAIARRIAEGGREWSDEERAAVQQQLDADKAYAAQQITSAG
jgi:hypothetical protein